MRTVCSMLVVLGVAVVLVLGASAQEKKKEKEVTLKGKITCAKCELKLKDATKCATVIVVKGKKDKEKDKVYYFDKKAHTKYHSDICKEGKEGTVKGKVSKEGKKEVVTVSELKYDE